MTETWNLETFFNSGLSFAAQRVDLALHLVINNYNEKLDHFLRVLRGLSSRKLTTSFEQTLKGWPSGWPFLLSSIYSSGRMPTHGAFAQYIK
jgi:hypothetical protein